ncbi:hypothetical protein THAOC_22503 [Thalassiosira oceanica]|uniref:Uncharacterized protein n=1 Tax=Thalassiosira oceanica TaxID=159749 RepID=K0RWS4_THAOC|nr:hypothetical protein THAOC_22503 [Thalassiosira oceanica]|eukprot:EJK57450.1 hypothetical protein THAOC_22503 [Thalassiosira oceanica]
MVDEEEADSLRRNYATVRKLKLKATEHQDTVAQEKKCESLRILFLQRSGDLRYAIEAAPLYAVREDGTLDKSKPLKEGFYDKNRNNGKFENRDLNPEALGRLVDGVY